MNVYTNEPIEQTLLKALGLSVADFTFVRNNDEIAFTETLTGDKVVFKIPEDYDAELAAIRRHDKFIVEAHNYIHLIIEDSEGYFDKFLDQTEIELTGRLKGRISKLPFNSMIATNLGGLFKLEFINNTNIWDKLKVIGNAVGIETLIDNKFLFVEIEFESGDKYTAQSICSNPTFLSQVLNSILVKLSYDYGIRFINPFESFEKAKRNTKECKKLTWLEFGENEPIQYFLSAESHEFPHFRFLDYYHVIEYYFLVSSINTFSQKLNDLINIKIAGKSQLSDSQTWNRYKDIYKAYSKTDEIYEKDQIKTVIRELIGFDTIRAIIEDNNINLSNIQSTIFDDNETTVSVHKIFEPKTSKFKETITDTEKETFCNEVAYRIYKIRNKIVHTKKGEKIDVFIPTEANFKQMANDIELIRLLAFNLIVKMSMP